MSTLSELKSTRDDLKYSKKQYEKRLEEVKEIQKKIGNIPGYIDDANDYINKAKESIREGIQEKDISSAFDVFKKSSIDMNLSSMQYYIAQEIIRVSDIIISLEQEISRVEQLITLESDKEAEAVISGSGGGGGEAW